MAINRFQCENYMAACLPLNKDAFNRTSCIYPGLSGHVGSGVYQETAGDNK